MALCKLWGSVSVDIEAKIHGKTVPCKWFLIQMRKIFLTLVRHVWHSKTSEKPFAIKGERLQWWQTQQWVVCNTFALCKMDGSENCHC